MASGTKTPEKNDHGDDVKKPLFPSDGSSVDDLNNQFNMPSADSRFDQIHDLQKQVEQDGSGYDQDDPRSKAASRSSLGSQEEAAGSGASGAVGSAEGSLQNRVADAEAKGKAKRGSGLYSGKEKGGRFGGGLGGLRGKLTNMTRKRVATIAVTAVVGGGGIFSFSILSGPFQFIHMAKLLDGFHLDTNKDTSDTRFIKSARYIFYVSKPGSPIEKVRLGYFGNKIAKRVETNLLEKAGVKVEFENGRGRFVVDPKKLAGTDYDGFKNKSPAELKAHLEKINPGVPITTNPDGTLNLGGDGMKSRQERRLIKSLMGPAGYKGVPSSVAFRVTAKRWGATLHPIKKVDRAVEKKASERIKDWRKKRANRINNGERVTRVPFGGADPSDAAKEANATAQEGDATGTAVSEGDATKLDEFRQSLGGKVVGGGLVATGTLCLLRDLDKLAGAEKQAKVVAPMIRMFTELLSLGSQGPSGDDLTAEQMGYYAKQLHGIDSRGTDPATGKENRSGWNEAESLRAEQGKEKGGVAPTGTVKTAGKDGSPFSFTSEGALGEGLDKACSTAGIAIQLGLSAVTGGVASTLFGTAVGLAAGPTIMKQAADWLSGNAIDPFAVGADYGNIVTYGGRMTANSQMVSAGGRELDENEEKQVDTLAREGANEDFQMRSFASRTFDINDTRSLASTVAFSGATNIQSGVTESLTNPVAIISNTWFAQKLFGAQASAQNPSNGVDYDYGFKQYGFSEAEQDSPIVDNPYENARAVLALMPSYDCEARNLPHNCVFENNFMSEKVRDCFGVHIQWPTYDIVSFNEFKDGKPPDPTKLPAECNDPSEEWMRIRFYILDTQTMAGATCYEDTEASEEACALVAADETGGSGNAGAGSSSGAETGVTGVGGARIASVAEAEFAKNGNKVLETCGPNCGPEVQKYTGGPSGTSAPWCAWFVSWVYREAGFEFKGAPAGSDGNIPAVAGLVSWFKQYGIHFTPNSSQYKPQPGDVVMYGGNVHTGIVVKVTGDTIETIEGNTSADGNFSADGGTVGRKTFNYKTYSSRSIEFGRLK
ncbi:MAG: CHAP domain-containing protein [Candidatus Saccharimonadales bacterium]